MRHGFVYILLNPSFVDQVKIGQTTRTSEKRATELSRPTGVPSPFIVVYDELVSDVDEVEARMHRRFEGFRVQRNREFFRVPMRDAIKALQEEASRHRVDASTARSVEILPGLRTRYGDALRPDITSVKIVQVRDVCFLETVRQTMPQHRDEIVERTDLSFISDGSQPMFPVERPAEENATRFLADMDGYGIINCTNLFTEEAARRIAAEWERSQS